MNEKKDYKNQDDKISRFLSFKTGLSVFCLYILTPISFCQTFAPAPGNSGSTAIKNDSSIIVAWATGILVERGFMNIVNPSAGLASFGLDAEAVGPAEGNSTNVVSIGDSGIAILTFERGIKNEIGPDFAIFENGFADNFIELAFVEVSSDGINYFRFPSVSEAPFIIQTGAFDFSDCRYFNNLAGKYRQGYGTPFDLEELSGIAGLDISKITHVKLIDVVGTIDPIYASVDFQGNIINDLYPTEFASGGFDLDGVAVIHQAPLSINEIDMHVSIYPNPTSDFITVSVPNESFVRLSDVSGKVLLEESIFNSKVIDLSKFDSSVLFIEISNSIGRSIEKVIVKK